MACEDSIWVFGYGSLIWKPNIEFIQKKRGRVKGYMRRFWQKSTDHRGVPEAPGRVATLVKNEGSVVWGYAYEISRETQKQVFDYLAVREKCGYELVEITFFSEMGEEIRARCYMGTDDNPEFLKFEEMQQTAEVISKSSGHSGTNREYLDNLVIAARDYFPEENDQYLSALSEMVKGLL